MAQVTNITETSVEAKELRNETGNILGINVGRYEGETNQINDKYDVYKETVQVNTDIKNVNRDWTLSNLTDYEKRFVIEMSKTGVYVEEWMKPEYALGDEDVSDIATKTGQLFSDDFLKRLIISRAKNGMVVKGGIVAVIGGANSVDENIEKSGEKKGGGMLSKLPIIGGMFNK